MSEIFDWSTTAAGNNDAPPDGWPEGMNRSEVNNSAREVMAAVRRLMDTHPWLELTKDFTISKINDTQFRVAGGDFTSIYSVNRQVQMVGTTTTYGRITNTSFTAGDTVVTVDVDGPNDVPVSMTKAMASILTPESNVALKSELSPTATEREAPSPNLIRDFSFEDDDLTMWAIDDGGGTGWSLNTGTQDRSGNISVQYDPTSQVSNATLRGNGATFTSKIGQVPARQGDVFKFEVYAKFTGTSPGGANKIQIGVEFRAFDGTLIGSADLSAGFDPAVGYGLHTHFTAGAPVDTIYAVPIVQIASGSPAGIIYHLDDVFMGLDLRRTMASVPVVASAATITMPEVNDTVMISGTTTITSITASYAGRRITLQFIAALTVTNGSNLKLQADFATAADRTLTMVSDGTNWWETGRSKTQPFDEVFTSAAQTIGNAFLLTIPHGLSRVPTLVQAYLINTTADRGYSIGDQVWLGHISDGDASRGFSAFVDVGDTTNIKVKFSLTINPIAIRDKDTGNVASALNANWDFFIRCWA